MDERPPYILGEDIGSNCIAIPSSSEDCVLTPIVVKNGGAMRM